MPQLELHRLAEAAWKLIISSPERYKSCARAGDIANERTARCVAVLAYDLATEMEAAKERIEAENKPETPIDGLPGSG